MAGITSFFPNRSVRGTRVNEGDRLVLNVDASHADDTLNARPETRINYERLWTAAKGVYGAALVHALTWLIFYPPKTEGKMAKIKMTAKDGAITKNVVIYIGGEENDVTKPEAWTLNRLLIAGREEIAANLKKIGLSPLAKSLGMDSSTVQSLLPTDFVYYCFAGFEKYIAYARHGDANWVAAGVVMCAIKDRQSSTNSTWLSDFVFQLSIRNSRWTTDEIKTALRSYGTLYESWLNAAMAKKNRTNPEVAGITAMLEDMLSGSGGNAEKIMNEMMKEGKILTSADKEFIRSSVNGNGVHKNAEKGVQNHRLRTWAEKAGVTVL